MSILLKIRKLLHTSLTDQQKKKFREFQTFKFRGLQGFIYQILFGSNLKALSFIYSSDKWGAHYYVLTPAKVTH